MSSIYCTNVDKSTHPTKPPKKEKGHKSKDKPTKKPETAREKDELQTYSSNGHSRSHHGRIHLHHYAKSMDEDGTTDSDGSSDRDSTRTDSKPECPFNIFGVCLGGKKGIDVKPIKVSTQD
ncbi:hypothetical protein HDV02_002089 [Globomyces sp. JEL0801]|nr:hypothetical protein HDV02_002089 [Globomyces sp. JEL0801]